MAELMLIKQAGVLIPATPTDTEQLQKTPAGSLVNVKYSVVRNGPFHRKFFALLNLGFEYWEPAGGLVTPAEVNAVRRFAQFLGRYGGNMEALGRAGDAFLGQWEQSRGERLPAPTKSFEAYRKWVTTEAGFYDLVTLPNGAVRKEAKSISFARMDQTEFDELYRSAFSVLWRFVLSQAFPTEQAAETAVNQLMGYA